MKKLTLTTIIIILILPQFIFSQSTAELLGYDSTAIVLIVNADDFGMCHAENTATMDLLQSGDITSSTIMVPCPWFTEAAIFCSENPHLDVGIHFTLTSEWLNYKWAGVASSDLIPSLLIDDGFFPASSYDVEKYAQRDEVEIELRAQLEKAIRSGITPTHIDNHMGSVYGLSTGNDFFDVIFQISKEYNLPFRLPRHISAPWNQMIPPVRQVQLMALADSLTAQGFVLPDYLKVLTNHGNSYEDALKNYLDLIRNLDPGVTEIYIHAAIESNEIKAITTNWEARKWDHQVFKSMEMKALIDSMNIHYIGWRDLQELQKSQLPTAIQSIPNSIIPETLTLQNYPNPFNASTIIKYTILQQTKVTLSVYNALGEKAVELVNELQSPGSYRVNWRADNFSSGVYFVRLNDGEKIIQSKILLIK